MKGRQVLKKAIRFFVKENPSKLTSYEKNILEKNKKLKKVHSGERCFILATGPTINSQNLKLLQGETCIAVSNFFVHPDYTLISPKYHCIAPFHPPITEQGWHDWMKSLDATAPDGTRMIFGLSDINRNAKDGLFKNREKYYLKFGDSIKIIEKRGVDFSGTLMTPQSVAIIALMSAVYMGFKEIYILGCEHDTIMRFNQEKSSHFYQEKQDAKVRDGYNEWNASDFEAQLKSSLNLWQQYKAVNKYVQTQGIKIYNATAGGILDVFPRVELESLFEKEVLANS